MSHLIREACTLRFVEHEFVEFFGVVSPLDEDTCSYGYSLERDGLRLSLTVFPLDGSVFTDLYREGIDEPVVTSRLSGCTHSRIVVRAPNRCLEIGRPEHITSEPSAPLTWGVRLVVEPHFRIEFIHEAA